MTVRKKYITGNPGTTAVSSAELAYVEIMLVMREGKIIYPSDNPNPSAKFFYYDQSSGTINFSSDMPFAGPTFGRPDVTKLETIYVEYKF